MALGKVEVERWCRAPLCRHIVRLSFPFLPFIQLTQAPEVLEERVRESNSVLSRHTWGRDQERQTPEEVLRRWGGDGLVGRALMWVQC